MDQAKLDEVINKYRSWSLKVLSDLISIPTVNPPGLNYAKFVEYVKNLLYDLGMKVDIIEVPKNIVAKYYPDCADYPRYILIARTGTKRPVLHFNGHYDVVPPGTGWNTDPFKPVIKDGRIYGRGAADMKGGILAFLLAIRVFNELFNDYNGSLEVALVPDEEIGSLTGTYYMLENNLAMPTYAIISEPSGESNLWIGHRGALRAYIEVYGKQAHGSTPWLGVNAFEYMVRVAEKFISEYTRMIKSKVSRYAYDDPRGARPSITLGGKVLGGDKENIVPGYCAFSIDRRLIVEETIEEVENELKDFISNMQREFSIVKLNFKIISKKPPAVTDPKGRLVSTVSNIIKNVLKKDPSITVCVGGLDTHYYSSKNIEVITYGPGPVSTAHAANEYLNISELFNVAKVYVQTMRELLS